MAVPWGVTLWMARMVWLALSGWVTSCLTVADEIAGSFRTGDIDGLHTECAAKINSLDVKKI
ncbi:hypothetical protein CsSME_00039273 [Camellia sinensis var. sinensis]